MLSATPGFIRQLHQMQSLPYSLSPIKLPRKPPLRQEAFFATILTGDFAHKVQAIEGTPQNHQYRTRESDFEQGGTRGQESSVGRKRGVSCPL